MPRRGGGAGAARARRGNAAHLHVMDARLNIVSTGRRLQSYRRYGSMFVIGTYLHANCEYTYNTKYLLTNILYYVVNMMTLRSREGNG